MNEAKCGAGLGLRNKFDPGGLSARSCLPQLAKSPLHSVINLISNLLGLLQSQCQLRSYQFAKLCIRS